MLVSASSDIFLAMVAWRCSLMTNYASFIHDSLPPELLSSQDSCFAKTAVVSKTRDTSRPQQNVYPQGT